MILKKLLSGINCDCFGDLDLKIESLFFDGRSKVKNGLFFCLNGTNTNGCNFVWQAIANGAIAIVTPQKLDVDITQVVVNDVRKVMSLISANFYDNPQNKLKVVGITGTSGKTSTSYIIAHMLKTQNKKVGVIGTSGIFIGEKKYEATLTTPDSIMLFAIFCEMVKNDIEYVIMEVSAHAIYYSKVYGIDFEVKVLTNVMADHLDFFKTENNYQQTKLSFFNSGKHFVVFGDDKVGSIIKHSNNAKTITYGFNNTNDCVIKNFELDIKGSKFEIMFENKCQKIISKLIGVFNLQNIVCSFCVVRYLLGEFDFQGSIANLTGLDGRFQTLFCCQRNIVIDYAHTADSLKSFLQTVKNVSKNKNIIVLGCPGERDSFKREQMGEIAGNFCDIVILTSDNPASENPNRIMWEMKQGVKKTKAKCYLVENRRMAIKKALLLQNEQFNVLIVGKGTEKYQIVGDRRIKFNDLEVVKNFIKFQN